MRQVIISNNTINLTSAQAYPAFAGKGITFVVTDDITFNEARYYVAYLKDDKWISHRFTSSEILDNTFTWTDTRAVPENTSIKFYIETGINRVYTTIALVLEKPHNPYEKSLVYYGTPASIGSATTTEEAAAIYGEYDVVILGEDYEDPTHTSYTSTKEVCDLVSDYYLDTRMVGYIPLGNRSTAEGWSTDDKCYTEAQLETKVDNWVTLGCSGIFLDEYGYNYNATRSRQNTIVDYIHGKGLFVIENSSEYTYAFDITTETYEGHSMNPDHLESKLTYGDYHMFKDAFYKTVSSTLVAQTPVNVNKMYEFWNTAGIYGKTYPEYYHVNSFQLDDLPTANSTSNKLKTFSILGGSLFHNTSVAISSDSNTAVVDWSYSDINLYSEDIPGVIRELKTASSVTFAYSWATTINDQKIKIIYDVATADTTTYSDSTHYMQYKDRYIVDAWTSMYDLEKQIQDSGGGTQIQSDWNQTDTSKVDYIKNKPTISDATVTILQGSVTKGSFTLNQSTSTTITLDTGSTQVQSDWTESSTTAVSYIKNKPTLATVATSGSYNDLSDTPTIPTVNDPTINITQGSVAKGSFTLNQASTTTIDLDAPVQANWTQSTTTEKDYIKNKPDLDATYLKVSGNSQTVISTNSNVGFNIQSNAAGCYLGFKNKSGAFLGYYYVDSNKKAGFYDGTDYTLISLAGHEHAAADVTSGTFDAARIPSLAASKITSGTFDIARIPTIPSTKTSGFATVATSGSYNDLSDKPTIPDVYDSTITINLNGSTLDSFTLNQSTSKTISIAETQADWNQSTTTAVDYIKNKPTIPSTDDCVKTTYTGTQTIYSSSSNVPLSLKGSGSAGTYLKLLSNTGVHLGSFGANSSKKPVFNNASSITEMSLVGHTHTASDITSGLATVATSGSYNDLSDTPTIPTITKTDVTIATSAWSAGTATVTVTGMTASTNAQVTPAHTSMAAVIESKVYCSGQGTNTLTFTCDTTPSDAIVFGVYIYS